MKLSQKILNDWVDHYTRTRQVGHTKSMIEGVETNNPMIIIRIMGDRGRIQKMIKGGYDNFCTTNDIKNKLGNISPVVWDNRALFSLFSSCLSDFDKFQKEIDSLKEKLNLISELACIND